MRGRPYRRGATRLSPLLIATIALGALAALVWGVAVTLSIVWDVDVEIVGPVLLSLMVATVMCAGVELTRNEAKWVRVAGVLLVVAAVIAVLLTLLTLLYVWLLCRNGCN